jgi:hypothetical protein
MRIRKLETTIEALNAGRRRMREDPEKRQVLNVGAQTAA